MKQSVEDRLKRTDEVLGTLISWMAQSANSPINRKEAERLLAMLTLDSTLPEHSAKPKIINGFPRRNRIDLLTPAEKAIYDAVRSVEDLPPDVRLTEAVVLLQTARDRVADYIEGTADSAVSSHS